MAILPHDSSGFLIGERLVNGIDLVGKDTAEILKILRASFGFQVISNNRLRVTLDRINNKLSSQTIDVTPAPSPVPRLGDGNGNPPPTIDIGAPPNNNRPIPPTRELGNGSGQSESPRSSGAGNSRPPAQENPSDSPTPPTPNTEPPTLLDDAGRPIPPTPLDDGRRNNGRRRNARGQFEGEGSGGLINGIKNAVRDGFAMGDADTQNIDPTVDAVRELSTLMSPLAKVGKTMFKGAAWLFRRKKKREEPSDQEQRQQSRIEKLLKRIAGSRVGQAAGSGFNLFGGLFSSLAGTSGGLLSGLGKILTGAILPALGLTAAFKLGEWIGGKIYEAIGPALGNTIDAVMAIPEKIGNAWDTFTGGLSDYFKEKWHNVTEKTKEIVSNTQDKVGSVGDFAAYQTDKMLATVGATKAIREAAQERLNQRDRGEIGFTPQNYQAQTSNKHTLGQVMRDTGEALTTQPSSHKYAPLLDEIAKGESKSGAFGTSGYDAIYGGAKAKPSKPISQMTVGEVKAYQQQLIKAGSGSSAVGRYQFIKNDDAFAKMTAQAGLKDTDIFDSATQDRLAIHYMGGEKKINELLRTGNDAALANITARQWASMKNASGRGNYDGDKIGNFARHGGITVMQKTRQQILENKTQPTVNKTTTPQSTATVDDFVATPLRLATTQTISPATPASVPKLLARPMPEVPKQKQQVSTKEQKPIQVSVVGGNEAIGQNLSDRHLAHAVTGGLGMDTLRMG